MTIKRATIILVLAVLLWGARSAQASTITYTVSATATGTLGADSFTNALVTITFVADTSTAHPKSGVPNEWINSGTGTVTIAGIAGTATFSSGPLVFDEQGGPTHSCSSAIGCFAGIGAGTPVGPTLLAVMNSGFLTYDLNAAIGPLSGASMYDTSLTVGTSMGGLNFSSVGDSTFTATTVGPTVPEPSSLILIGTGLASLVRFARHRFS